MLHRYRDRDLVDMPPGSAKGLQLVVADADAAHAELDRPRDRGQRGPGVPLGPFVFFSDPDGNGWSVQQLPARD